MKNAYKEDELFDRTKIIFKQAIDYFRYLREINDFNDSDPSDYNIRVTEFQAGLDILDHIIIDNKFVDEDAFLLIFESVECFRQHVLENFPLLARSLRQYLDFIKEHRRK